MSRVIILVIDGFGIGHAPDADKFGDVTANSFANMASYYFKETNQKINIPNLTSLGLVNLVLKLLMRNSLLYQLMFIKAHLPVHQKLVQEKIPLVVIGK